MSPARVRASAAAKRNVSTARSASPRAVFSGLAASTAMIRAKSSRRSASRRAAVSRISARCQRGSGPAASAALAIGDGTIDLGRAAHRHPPDHRAVVGRRDLRRRRAGEALTGQRHGVDRRRIRTRRSHGSTILPVRGDPISAQSPVPRLRRDRLAFAHRGGASEAPENTLPAFQNAVDLGYRYLETDVHVTADGVVVAFHDDDLSRTCGRPGLIHELPWSEVATARVDGTEPIPRLDDLLEAFPDAPHQHRLQDRRRRRAARRRARAAPGSSIGCASAGSATSACAGCGSASGRGCAPAPARSSSACCGSSASPRPACGRPRCRRR